MSRYGYRTVNVLHAPLGSDATKGAAGSLTFEPYVGLPPAIVEFYAGVEKDRRMLGGRQLSPSKICWYERNRKNGRA